MVCATAFFWLVSSSLESDEDSELDALGFLLLTFFVLSLLVTFPFEVVLGLGVLFVGGSSSLESDDESELEVSDFLGLDFGVAFDDALAFTATGFFFGASSSLESDDESELELSAFFWMGVEVVTFEGAAFFTALFLAPSSSLESDDESEVELSAAFFLPALGVCLSLTCPCPLASSSLESELDDVSTFFFGFFSPGDLLGVGTAFFFPVLGVLGVEAGFALSSSLSDDDSLSLLDGGACLLAGFFPSEI